MLLSSSEPRRNVKKGCGNCVILATDLLLSNLNNVARIETEVTAN
jgi:hypothetical protein